MAKRTKRPPTYYEVAFREQDMLERWFAIPAREPGWSLEERAKIRRAAKPTAAPRAVKLPLIERVFEAIQGGTHAETGWCEYSLGTIGWKAGTKSMSGVHEAIQKLVADGRVEEEVVGKGKWRRVIEPPKEALP